MAVPRVRIAMSEREHRSLLERAFPGLSGAVRYWDVEDVDSVAGVALSAKGALDRIELLAAALIEELATGR